MLSKKLMLLGEIGVGKYNLARLLHGASHSCGPLLTINCASLENIDIDNMQQTSIFPLKNLNFVEKKN